MTSPLSITYKSCDKLRHINTIDFGVPGGRTCPWKTETCFCFCYGRSGRWVANYKSYARLREIEELPGKAFYHAISAAFLANGFPLRVGRVGDAANIEHTRAVIDAILEYNIPFMWTTRAWRAPKSATWQLFEKYLPGQIFCSLDQESDKSQVPAGWPTASIAMPPVFDTDPGVCWCPHYPAPGFPITPVYNCIECMICYARPGDRRQRPDIAFMLHTTGTDRVLRQHYPRGYWLKHKSVLCKRHPVSAQHPNIPEGHDSHKCGIFTPDGWLAPDDNA